MLGGRVTPEGFRLAGVVSDGNIGHYHRQQFEVPHIRLKFT